MTSYLDFLNYALKNGLGGPSQMYGLYRDLYENSHGAERYLYSKVPIFSRVKAFEDELRNQQDYYDQTGTDPQYIQSVNRIGVGGSDGLSGQSDGITRMARSIVDLYTADVREEVGNTQKKYFDIVSSHPHFKRR